MIMTRLYDFVCVLKIISLTKDGRNPHTQESSPDRGNWLVDMATSHIACFDHAEREEDVVFSDYDQEGKVSLYVAVMVLKVSFIS